jgi:hypothetical protein
MTAGAWSRSQGRPLQLPSEPPWLQSWLQQLRGAMQRADAGQRRGHPLLQAAPRVVTMGRAPLAGPVGVTAASWNELLCTAPASTAAVTGGLEGVLLDEAEDGQLTVGIEWHCRQRTTWVRAVRLVAQVDTRGQVRSVGGLRLEARLEMPAGAAPDTRWAWPLRSADIDPTRVVWPLGHGQGWLAQLAWGDHAVAADDGTIHSWTARDADRETEGLQRLLLWLGVDGLPQAVLLQGGVLAAGRLVQPLPHESADDTEVSDAPGVQIHLRVAHFGQDGVTRHSTLLAWHLQDGRVQPWPIPLPGHDGEGMWRCAVEPDGLAMLCHFVASGAMVTPMADVRMTAEPKRQRWRIAEESRK